ncbi:MAG: hypothetical protein Q9216_003328 [Gyalolechia sp. 2 TL-2023]
MPATDHASTLDMVIMTLKVGRTAPYQRIQAQTTNSDAPPSSIAAQLDRLANANRGSSDDDQQGFNLLLQEILDGNDDVWKTDGIADINAPASSQLIQVIVQAGLNTHHSGGSNAVSPRKPSDIIRSLQAIDMTLSRCPDALFQPLELDSSSGFPLFAWLIPGVLAEINDCKFQSIEQLVLKLIQRSWSIAERAVTRLRRSSQIENYLRGLITDLVYSIETWDIGKDGSCRPVHPPVPTSETIKEVFPDHCQFASDITLYQVNPRGASQAFMLANIMLCGSVPPLDERRTTQYYRHLALLERAITCLTDLPGLPPNIPKSGHSVARTVVLPYGPDLGADNGPRKRLRLDTTQKTSNIDDIDLLLNKRILQILGLPNTTSLSELTSNKKNSKITIDASQLFNLRLPVAAEARKLLALRVGRKMSYSGGGISHQASSGTEVRTIASICYAGIETGPQPLQRTELLRPHHVFARSILPTSLSKFIAGLTRDSRLLPTFLRNDIDEDLLRRNRVLALDFLRSLSEKSELSLQETCILAWGQIARISSGDETNIVLLRLVNYLGHTNPLICGLAYDELQWICNHSSFSALKLVAPFWRTLAPTVVQDLHRRPQIAQYLSDLLSLSVSELLRLTQIYTLPYLVLTKQRDLLNRIADACNRSIQEICMDPDNMSAILAYIMLQSSVGTEATIMTAFQVISSDFVNVNCSELVKAEPVLTASELLKAAGDFDGSMKPSAYEALHFLASLMNGKHGTPRGTARKNSITGSFFETHVLGIMANLSDTINDSKGTQAAGEKLRCLRAIQEMIKIAKSNVNNALPQISACLRSALKNPELCNEAFLSWMAMIGALGADEVLTLIEPTFAIIVQYWDSFKLSSQTQAYHMISQLLQTQAASIRDVVHTIPSLGSIPLMSKFEDEINKLKHQMSTKHQLQSLIERSQHENLTVVGRALIELEMFLEKHQSFLYELVVNEQPDSIISELARTLLDVCVQASDSDDTIAILSARCIGLLGCLDPTKIEAPREKKEVLVLSNFQEEDETVDFVLFFLQEVLVKAFLSATNPRAQGFLAFAMQELLKFCGINGAVTARHQEKHANSKYLRWFAFPESIRNNLTPFLNSKYVVTAATAQPDTKYPIYHPDISHGQWLRTFVYDLLRKGQGDNVVDLFDVFSRVIRTQDTPISTFLLPFAVLNILICGTEFQRRDVSSELLVVLRHTLPEGDPATKSSLVYCSQNIFQVLDYLSRWCQEKKKEISASKTSSSRLNLSEIETVYAQIHSVESVIETIPADVISRRAVDCKSYARALFYWEQYIRQQRLEAGNGDNDEDMEPLYERLQQIYTQIDEPDGIEGISSHLQVLDIDQQILEHRKAGRWTAVQSWYELLLSERPQDADVQYNLLTCLKESGQHDVLLNQVDGFNISSVSSSLPFPFACEASWVTGKWKKLEDYLAYTPASLNGNFNIGVGRALLALAKNEKDNFVKILDDVRRRTTKRLSATNTASLQACHDALLKLHALTEIEAIAGRRKHDSLDKLTMVGSLNQRLDLLGAFSSDKQYLLGLRRAAMQLSEDFSDLDVASAWLTSAKLARKAGFVHQSFKAVLHASQLGDNSATIEHSRLLWKEGHHRKAIQSLKGAIAANAFRSHEYLQTENQLTTVSVARQQEQNVPKARAHLLLAKWVDRAGQTQSESIVQEYKQAIKWYARCEKAHYYLGKHYNKLLEHQKARAMAKRAQTFLSGETAKLVVENYLRSLAYGAKYIHQTLPRALTVWLELGIDIEQPAEIKHGSPDFWAHTVQQRHKILTVVNAHVKKMCDRLPAFVFYTAFSQIVARIVHPNSTISPLLVDIVAKVIGAHPQQALWTLLAVVKSSNRDRALRGRQCLDKIYDNSKRSKNDTDGKDLKALITHGQKLSDQLLHVCEGDIQGKPSTISLTRDLSFVHKTAPCRLVVPLESTLSASLPAATDNVDMRRHRAFSKDTVTISAFLDQVLVLNSLQKPRKISLRGSDGHVYALLCKPKDDLRKDQRLMEFNTMINRFLKKDAESSQRRLYIKTYAVTPLNEECGLIEWVDNLKTLREILLSIYRQKNIVPNYTELRTLLTEACSSPSKTDIFVRRVLPKFPAVFHEWFVDMFAEPGAWFAARLRYTRSCAVMSIVGHVLGLGDRHGENILFEEGNGGTFHVDFNCLFDKGLTFEKPELVPFRLTHNMVDAFGAYGYEGPFRKSCELTLRILRQHEDTLMTILETFLYDPTTDFIGKKKKRQFSPVPDTPEGVLDSVRNKVRGLLPAESVPLSVEGYVDELIMQATDPERLAAMYMDDQLVSAWSLAASSQNFAMRMSFMVKPLGWWVVQVMLVEL